MAEGGQLINRGRWISFPFIIGSVFFLNIALSGWLVNLIVYLIDEFNIGSVDAAQINNVVNGCTCVLTVLAAIIADSYLGCFLVASVSSVISLLGIVLLALTAMLRSLRPQESCNVGSSCRPSGLHLSFLYMAIALASLGMSGFRFILGTMGADQFRAEPGLQASFFNWLLFAQYIAYLVSSTLLVYVEDNVSWGLGFGICASANLVGIVILVLGKRYYYNQKPEGSPFAQLAQVVVAASRKRKYTLAEPSFGNYYQGSGLGDIAEKVPNKSFRFFNRAALKTEGDLDSSGNLIPKPWRLCTVQQVEELKILIRIFPLWSSTIFLSTPIAMQNSMTVLQALKMDRRWGTHFTVPAGTVLVLVMISASISIVVIDRILSPFWHRLDIVMTKKRSSPAAPAGQIRRIGIGHVFNVLGMVASAVVESRRLRATTPVPVAWLFPQLILVGVGEAFHFPGQVALYYREFPDLLKGSATAMISMVIGISFYMSTGLTDAIRRGTGWLPEDIDHGRLDLVFWLLAGIGMMNFGYYAMCARFYCGGFDCQPVENPQQNQRR